MAMEWRHLETAERAFAATGDIEKLHFILHVKQIPSQAGQVRSNFLLLSCIHFTALILREPVSHVCSI